nr:PREDICTED: uncharacterized protein LOC106702702 [Latimeria chalumnae]|eukprot:XP_014341172.1 PREDICTED: uncharacterized protein LOC106702702 [Latimeria chalumnae]
MAQVLQLSRSPYTVLHSRVFQKPYADYCSELRITSEKTDFNKENPSNLTILGLQRMQCNKTESCLCLQGVDTHTGKAHYYCDHRPWLGIFNPSCLQTQAIVTQQYGRTNIYCITISYQEVNTGELRGVTVICNRCNTVCKNSCNKDQCTVMQIKNGNIYSLLLKCISCYTGDTYSFHLNDVQKQKPQLWILKNSDLKRILSGTHVFCQQKGILPKETKIRFRRDVGTVPSLSSSLSHPAIYFEREDIFPSTYRDKHQFLLGSTSTFISASHAKSIESTLLLTLSSIIYNLSTSAADQDWENSEQSDNSQFFYVSEQITSVLTFSLEQTTYFESSETHIDAQLLDSFVSASTIVSSMTSLPQGSDYIGLSMLGKVLLFSEGITSTPGTIETSNVSELLSVLSTNSEKFKSAEILTPTKNISTLQKILPSFTEGLHTENYLLSTAQTSSILQDDKSLLVKTNYFPSTDGDVFSSSLIESFLHKDYSSIKVTEQEIISGIHSLKLTGSPGTLVSSALYLLPSNSLLDVGSFRVYSSFNKIETWTVPNNVGLMSSDFINYLWTNIQQSNIAVDEQSKYHLATEILTENILVTPVDIMNTQYSHYYTVDHVESLKPTLFLFSALSVLGLSALDKTSVQDSLINKNPQHNTFLAEHFEPTVHSYSYLSLSSAKYSNDNLFDNMAINFSSTHTPQRRYFPVTSLINLETSTGYHESSSIKTAIDNAIFRSRESKEIKIDSTDMDILFTMDTFSVSDKIKATLFETSRSIQLFVSDSSLFEDKSSIVLTDLLLETNHFSAITPTYTSKWYPYSSVIDTNIFENTFKQSPDPLLSTSNVFFQTAKSNISYKTSLLQLLETHVTLPFKTEINTEEFLNTDFIDPSFGLSSVTIPSLSLTDSNVLTFLKSVILLIVDKTTYFGYGESLSTTLFSLMFDSMPFTESFLHSSMVSSLWNQAGSLFMYTVNLKHEASTGVSCCAPGTTNTIPQIHDLQPSDRFSLLSKHRSIHYRTEEYISLIEQNEPLLVSITSTICPTYTFENIEFISSSFHSSLSDFVTVHSSKESTSSQLSILLHNFTESSLPFEYDLTYSIIQPSYTENYFSFSERTDSTAIQYHKPSTVQSSEIQNTSLAVANSSISLDKVYSFLTYTQELDYSTSLQTLFSVSEITSTILQFNTFQHSNGILLLSEYRSSFNRLEDKLSVQQEATLSSRASVTSPTHAFASSEFYSVLTDHANRVSFVRSTNSQFSLLLYNYGETSLPFNYDLTYSTLQLLYTDTLYSFSEYIDNNAKLNNFYKFFTVLSDIQGMSQAVDDLTSSTTYIWSANDLYDMFLPATLVSSTEILDTRLKTPNYKVDELLTPFLDSLSAEPKTKLIQSTTDLSSFILGAGHTKTLSETRSSMQEILRLYSLLDSNGFSSYLASAYIVNPSHIAPPLVIATSLKFIEDMVISEADISNYAVQDGNGETTSEQTYSTLFSQHKTHTSTEILDIVSNKHTLYSELTDSSIVSTMMIKPLVKGSDNDVFISSAYSSTYDTKDLVSLLYPSLVSVVPISTSTMHFFDYDTESLMISEQSITLLPSKPVSTLAILNSDVLFGNEIEVIPVAPAVTSVLQDTVLSTQLYYPVFSRAILDTEVDYLSEKAAVETSDLVHSINDIVAINYHKSETIVSSLDCDRLEILKTDLVCGNNARTLTHELQTFSDSYNLESSETDSRSFLNTVMDSLDLLSVTPLDLTLSVDFVSSSMESHFVSLSEETGKVASYILSVIELTPSVVKDILSFTQTIHVDFSPILFTSISQIPLKSNINSATVYHETSSLKLEHFVSVENSIATMSTGVQETITVFFGGAENLSVLTQTMQAVPIEDSVGKYSLTFWPLDYTHENLEQFSLSLTPSASLLHYDYFTVLDSSFSFPVTEPTATKTAFVDQSLSFLNEHFIPNFSVSQLVTEMEIEGMKYDPLQISSLDTIKAFSLPSKQTSLQAFFSSTSTATNSYEAFSSTQMQTTVVQSRKIISLYSEQQSLMLLSFLSSTLRTTNGDKTFNSVQVPTPVLQSRRFSLQSEQQILSVLPFFTSTSILAKSHRTVISTEIETTTVQSKQDFSLHSDKRTLSFLPFVSSSITKSHGALSSIQIPTTTVQSRKTFSMQSEQQTLLVMPFASSTPIVAKSCGTFSCIQLQTMTVKSTHLSYSVTSQATYIIQSGSSQTSKPSSRVTKPHEKPATFEPRNKTPTVATPLPLIEEENLLAITLKVNRSVNIFGDDFRNTVTNGLQETFLKALEVNETKAKRSTLEYITVTIQSISRQRAEDVLVQFAILSNGKLLKASEAVEIFYRLPNLIEELNNRIPFQVVKAPSSVAMTSLNVLEDNFIGWLAAVVVLAVVCVVLLALLISYVKKQSRRRTIALTEEPERFMKERSRTSNVHFEESKQQGKDVEKGKAKGKALPRISPLQMPDFQIPQQSQFPVISESNRSEVTYSTPHFATNIDSTPETTKSSKKGNRKISRKVGNTSRHKVSPVDERHQETFQEQCVYSELIEIHSTNKERNKAAAFECIAHMNMIEDSLTAVSIPVRFKTSIAPLPPLKAQRLTAKESDTETEDPVILPTYSSQQKQRKTKGNLETIGQVVESKPWAKMIDNEIFRKAEAERKRNKERQREKQRLKKSMNTGEALKLMEPPKGGSPERYIEKQKPSKERDKKKMSRKERELAAWKRAQAQLVEEPFMLTTDDPISFTLSFYTFDRLYYIRSMVKLSYFGPKFLLVLKTS